MGHKVKYINVVFSAGSFSEWMNNPDEQDPADVSRWEQSYDAFIKGRLESIYPSAEIEVGEGYDQTMETKISWDADVESAEEDGHEYEDLDIEIRGVVESVLDLAGNSLDEICK